MFININTQGRVCLTTTAILLFQVTLSSTAYVKKCCSVGQAVKIIEKAPVCVDVEIYKDLQWFPFPALYNRSTNKPMNDAEQKEVRKLLLNQSGFESFNLTRSHQTRRQYFNQKSYFLDNDTYSFRILVDDHFTFSILANVHYDLEHTQDISDEMSIVESDSVCLDVMVDGTYTAVYTAPMIKKCCKFGQHMNDSFICVSDTSSNSTHGWRPRGKGLENMNLFVSAKTGPYFKPPRNVNRRAYSSYVCRGIRDFQPLQFFPNGSALVHGEMHKHFCAETKMDELGRHTLHNIIVYYQPQPPDASESDSDRTETMLRVYGYLMLIGAGFLLVTVVIQLVVPKLRYQLHNKIAITHNATLMVAQIAWGVRLIADDDNIDSTGCTAKSLFIQYSFLSSLFWLNVFCLDVSSTFRKSVFHNRSAASERRRYVIYAVYAWGVPAIITLVTYLVEHMDDPLIPRPGFTCFCRYDGRVAEAIYLYGPMTMLLTANMTLYAFTTWKIIVVQRQTSRMLVRKDSCVTGKASLQNDRDKLVLYTKLFVVMGITWTFYVLVWLFDVGDSIFAEITNVVNVLRPVLIFFVFIWKRWVFEALKEKLCGKRGRLDAPNMSMRSTATTGSLLDADRSSRHKIAAASLNQDPRVPC